MSKQATPVIGTAKAPLFLLLLLISLMPNRDGYAANETTFIVGVVPQFEIRQTYNTWTPILDELKRRTGYTFKLSGSASIPDFEKQFSTGVFDFAYMNPYHILIANNKQHYVPLVRDAGSELRGILVVKKGTFSNVGQLEGKTIAFPAPNALGASLMVRDALNSQFKLKYQTTYVKSHSSVYLNVLLGLADAGGGIETTLEQQPADIRNNLEVLYTTKSFPSHPFASHPRVPIEVQNRVQQALLAFSNTPAGKTALSTIPFKQMGRASYDDYTSITSLNLEQFKYQEQ